MTTTKNARKAGQRSPFDLDAIQQLTQQILHAISRHFRGLEDARIEDFNWNDDDNVVDLTASLIWRELDTLIAQELPEPRDIAQRLAEYGAIFDHLVEAYSAGTSTPYGRNLHALGTALNSYYELIEETLARAAKEGQS